MNAKQKQIKLLGILVSLFVLCSCSTKTNSPPGPWQVVGFYDEHQSIMAAGFLDETHVITGGVIGQMAYSSDGAETWLETDAQADCRYGIEIVSPEIIWTCGGATNVRKSRDRGQTWQMLAAFGDPRTITNPCHSMSFLDENIGWLANSNLFGTTTDGGLSWNMRALPETANKIATIDTYLPGEGYLLDQSGVLFFTQDDGQHWKEKSRLELGELKMSFSAYQLAAMRFADADHGLIVISSSDYGKGTVIAFHTSDGGQSWTSETVPVLAGPVYLSRQGSLLTVITGANQLTLLRYEE